MAGESTENDPRWSEYNYPPLLKLFHYSISDLRDPMKSIARKLNAGAIVVLIIQPLQLLSTCLQLAAKCEVVRKRNLIYSILNCFLWPTLAFFIFHRGYVAICQGPLHTVSLMLFYGSSLCALIIWSYQAIAGGASNGIIKMVKLSQSDYVNTGNWHCFGGELKDQKLTKRTREGKFLFFVDFLVYLSVLQMRCILLCWGLWFQQTPDAKCQRHECLQDDVADY